MGHGQTVIDVVSLLVRKLRGLDTAATTAMADRVEQATEAVVNAVGTPVKAPEATGALPEGAGDGPVYKPFKDGLERSAAFDQLDSLMKERILFIDGADLSRPSLKGLYMGTGSGP